MLIIKIHHRTSQGADQAGAIQVADYVICNDAPDDEAAAACERLGSFLK